MDLSRLCNKVCEIAGETGDFINRESPSFNISEVREKGKHDLVSWIDIEAEKQLVNKLGKLLPEAGFITEEGTAEKESSGLVWIIDPLDGTTNFVHGIPVYSISIALADKNDTLLGVILNVRNSELFYAYKGGGAWLNGEKIKVSDAGRLDDCLVATGFPYKDYSKLDNYMRCLEFFIRNTQGVRRIGSAAIDLAYVACGRFEAFFEYGLNKWDVAAGVLMIREAGGKVSDFRGNEKIDGPEIIAANNNIFNTFSTEVIKHLAL